MATVTSPNKLISDSGNDAEHKAEHEDGHTRKQLAGDHGLEGDADLPTSDLDGASKSERYQTPAELAGDETDTKTSSPAKKKVMHGTPATATVKKVSSNSTLDILGISLNEDTGIEFWYFRYGLCKANRCQSSSDDKAQCAGIEKIGHVSTFSPYEDSAVVCKP